jgi:hypothetical protein
VTSARSSISDRALRSVLRRLTRVTGDSHRPPRSARLSSRSGREKTVHPPWRAPAAGPPARAVAGRDLLLWALLQLNSYAVPIGSRTKPGKPDRTFGRMWVSLPMAASPASPEIPPNALSCRDPHASGCERSNRSPLDLSRRRASTSPSGSSGPLRHTRRRRPRKD